MEKDLIFCFYIQFHLNVVSLSLSQISTCFSLLLLMSTIFFSKNEKQLKNNSHCTSSNFTVMNDIINSWYNYSSWTQRGIAIRNILKNTIMHCKHIITDNDEHVNGFALNLFRCLTISFAIYLFIYLSIYLILQHALFLSLGCHL